jgi:hypothetical protein
VLARMAVYMFEMPAQSAVLIASTMLSNDSISHRQFASIAPGPFDSRGSVIGPPGLAKTVFYMSRRLAESGLLIGLMMLSIASNSDRHRSAKPSAPFDFQGSVVGPRGLSKMVYYMSKRLAEIASLIASTVLSND